MEKGLVRRQPGPSPSKGHFRERTLKTDRQSHFRIAENGSAHAYRRCPTFQIGSPPIHRRSAFSTSGVLRHVCPHTGSVAVVLGANGGRFARQGEPPTVATADLCQRSIEAARVALQRPCRLPWTTTRSSKNRGEFSLCRSELPNPEYRAMGLDRRPRAPLCLFRSRLLLTLAPPCRVSPALNGTGYFYRTDKRGAGASPPEATGDSCISYAHHVVDDLG